MSEPESESSETEALLDFSDIYAGTISGPVDPGFMSWCPTMDMVMFTPAADSGGLIVYRLSGQIVWSTTSRKSQLRPTQIAWREDGTCLSVL